MWAILLVPYLAGASPERSAESGKRLSDKPGRLLGPGYPELMQQGRTLTSYTSYLIQTYLVVAMIYVVLNLLLTRLAQWLQGRTGRRAAAGHTRAEGEAATQAAGMMPAAQ